jgi:hypothetical protein
MGRTDYIGGRGEAIAYMRLSKVCRRNNLPYFFPHYLGEKCPTFDFLVELVGAGKRTPFFFVQVKTTTKGYTRRSVPPRLRVKVSAEDVRRMAAFPAPTYVVGVDETAERAFVIAVHGTMRERISSMTTAHELTCATLARLSREVRGHWRRNLGRKESSFTNGP